MHSSVKDMTGQRFGKLSIQSYAGQGRWLCKCDCGQEKVIWGASIRKGASRSCGCSIPGSNAKHGHARRGAVSPEYSSYHAMIKRCMDPKNKEYNRYGARGISVCTRWVDGEGFSARSGFECFVADMGRKPSPKHTLDRKDVDGHYSPENCKWSTPAEQNVNRGDTIRDIDGRPVVEKAREAGLNPQTVCDRYRRGDRGEALIRPVRRTK